jgi:hypothetical protein
MKKDRLCKYCDRLFEEIEGRIFSNHVRWCDKNTKNGDKGISTATDEALKRINEKLGDILPNEVNCKVCQKIFIVYEREKQFPKRDFYFCSRSCANTRTVSESMKEKIRQTLSKTMAEKGIFINKIYTKKCAQCGIDFNKEKNKIVCCSTACAARYRYRHVDRQSLQYYRRLCEFKFNLSDFPDEFDFSLIKKYGWYSAKNRGNNLSGVSRDHMVSVKYGYTNNIDPYIISHPANCRLLVHNENVSKHDNCEITLDELLNRIKNWDFKYKVKKLIVR